MRGKQFNSMVQRETDPLTGAGREDVLISEADAGARGLSDGDRVRLASACGEFIGRAKVAPIKPGNLEVHWPEGMGLLSGSAVDPSRGNRTTTPRSGSNGQAEEALSACDGALSGPGPGSRSVSGSPFSRRRSRSPSPGITGTAEASRGGFVPSPG